jgi:uncharacterized protein (UPF0548 family)
VILLREPSDAQIRRFLEGGASRCGAPPGYPVNHRRGRLGAGLETYARPVEAIRGWKMYETRWTKLCSPDVPIAKGTVVGVLGRHVGIWSLNACRVAYTIEEEAPLLKYCEFAFGTLAEPVEQGEECFPVEWRAADDTVFYEVFAFASPTPGPEAVLGRLPAEHGRSRRVWRETIGSVVT